MRNMTRFSIALVVLMWVSLASAQNSNSGDIRGTVTDATGAIIQGAKVTVTDVDKGVTTTYVTNSAGLYDTSSIVTDHYTVTFAKDGFSTLVRGPITLQVETLTVNGALNVGNTTETVQVTTDVPLLETETGTQSTTMPEQELQDLPNFASWENFIILAPGAAGAPSAGGANPGQATSVNGNAAFYNVLGCRCRQTEIPWTTTSTPCRKFRWSPAFRRRSMKTAVRSTTRLAREALANSTAIYSNISRTMT
jgi:hypothetical protein